MSKLIDETFDLLGMEVKDKVTGVEGIVTSVCFDLYGCVQATINRGLDKDGKAYEQWWYDVQRLKVLMPNPVMEVPDFKTRDMSVPTYDRGPAEKAPAKF